MERTPPRPANESDTETDRAEVRRRVAAEMARFDAAMAILRRWVEA